MSPKSRLAACRWISRCSGGAGRCRKVHRPRPGSVCLMYTIPRRPHTSYIRGHAAWDRGETKGPNRWGTGPCFEVLLLVLNFAVQQPLGRQQPASHSMTSDRSASQRCGSRCRADRGCPPRPHGGIPESGPDFPERSEGHQGWSATGWPCYIQRSASGFEAHIAPWWRGHIRAPRCRPSARLPHDA